jgi:hypothetical protein
LHNVKACSEPEQDRTGGNSYQGGAGFDRRGLKPARAGRTWPASTTETAAGIAAAILVFISEQSAQTTIEIFPDFIKIRRLVLRAISTALPRAGCGLVVRPLGVGG